MPVVAVPVAGEHLRFPGDPHNGLSQVGIWREEMSHLVGGVDERKDAHYENC